MWYFGGSGIGTVICGVRGTGYSSVSSWSCLDLVSLSVAIGYLCTADCGKKHFICYPSDNSNCVFQLEDYGSYVA